MVKLALKKPFCWAFNGSSQASSGAVMAGRVSPPAITAPEDAWLLPLKAQQSGFFSASFTTVAQSAAAADQLALHYQQAADPKAVARQFGRLVKHKLKK